APGSPHWATTREQRRGGPSRPRERAQPGGNKAGGQLSPPPAQARLARGWGDSPRNRQAAAPPPRHRGEGDERSTQRVSSECPLPREFVLHFGDFGGAILAEFWPSFRARLP